MVPAGRKAVPVPLVRFNRVERTVADARSEYADLRADIDAVHAVPEGHIRAIRGSQAIQPPSTGTSGTVIESLRPALRLDDEFVQTGKVIQER